MCVVTRIITQLGLLSYTITLFSFHCIPDHDDVIKWKLFRLSGLLCPPPTHHTQRPVTRSFDTFFDVRLNKPLSIHSWGWWVEMPSCSLWRHCNERGTQVCIMVVERQPLIKRGYGFALFVHIALTTKITEYCTPYFKMLRMKPHHAHMTHNDN